MNNASTSRQHYQINRTSVIAKAEGVQVREMEVASSQEVPWHFHTEMTDHCYCLKGRIAVESADDAGEATPALVLSPGESCILPPRRPHRITCAEGEVAVYLLVQTGGKYDFNVFKKDSK